MNKKAVKYLRFSSEEQSHFSIERQDMITGTWMLVRCLQIANREQFQIPLTQGSNQITCRSGKQNAGQNPDRGSNKECLNYALHSDDGI